MRLAYDVDLDDGTTRTFMGDDTEDAMRTASQVTRVPAVAAYNARPIVRECMAVGGTCPKHSRYTQGSDRPMPVPVGARCGAEEVV